MCVIDYTPYALVPLHFLAGGTGTPRFWLEFS
jgi:hypothetical protein